MTPLERMHYNIRKSASPIGDRRDDGMYRLHPEDVSGAPGVSVVFISVNQEHEEMPVGIYAGLNVPLDDFIENKNLQKIVSQYIGTRLMNGYPVSKLEGFLDISGALRVEISQYLFENDGIVYPLLSVNPDPLCDEDVRALFNSRYTGTI